MGSTVPYFTMELAVPSDILDHSIIRMSIRLCAPQIFPSNSFTLYAAHSGPSRRTAKLTMLPRGTASCTTTASSGVVGQALGSGSDPTERVTWPDKLPLTPGEHPLPTVMVQADVKEAAQSSSAPWSASSRHGGVGHPDDLQALPFINPHPSPETEKVGVRKQAIESRIDTQEAIKKSEQRSKKIQSGSTEKQEEGVRKTSRLEEIKKKLEEATKPYLQVPGPETEQDHLPAPRLLVVSSGESSSTSSPSSRGTAGASAYHVGKDQGARGQEKGIFYCKGRETYDYPLHQVGPCQTTVAAWDYTLAVPPSFEQQGREDDLGPSTSTADLGEDYSRSSVRIPGGILGNIAGE